MFIASQKIPEQEQLKLTAASKAHDRDMKLPLLQLTLITGGISLAELMEILGTCMEDNLDLEQLLEEVNLDINGEVGAK